MDQPVAPADNMPTAQFHLRLLGLPAATAAGGGQIVGLGPGKPLAILAYLAVRHQARRDELIELLWGDLPDAKARNAFRQALHRLRTALGEALIPQDPDAVRLGSRDLISIDRDLFVRACELTRPDDAISLYRGDFLEGLELGEVSFDRWADGERTRLRTRFEGVLREGARAALDSGNWEDALRRAERLTSVAPFDGEAAELEATVLVAAGRTGEALAVLRRYSARIKEDLDITPPQGVRDLTTRLERTVAKQQGVGTASTRASAASSRNPFVGREPELAKLVAVVRDLEHEHGATIVIDGEAGIGKTRLVDELLERVHSLGRVLILRGRERPGGAAVPYAGIAEAVRAIVKAPGVAGTSRHLLTEAARILPELRDAFELDAPSPIEDEGGRLRFFEGVAAVIDSAAYEQPVCLIVDDLHHTSSSTLDLLTYLAGRLENSPVVLLLLYRSDAASTQLQERLSAMARGRLGTDLDDGTDHGRISLGPLATPQIEALVSGYAALKGADGRVDAVRIAPIANGRPMRALDLARRAIEGSLGSDSPVRPRDILWARLQTASASQRRVFFAAALLERSASLRLLAAAAHLPEAATLDAAASLEQAGLLAQTGHGYGLAHDTTASFVVEVSGVAGRALLAGWAADALSQEEDATDAELAHLYAMAGRGSLAFTHARIAAYSAAAAGATSEVMRLLGGALTFAPDATARAEIEEAMRAFGAGGRRLLLPVSNVGPTTDTALDAPIEIEEEASAPADAVDIPDIPEHREPVFTPAPSRRAPALRPVFWVALVLASVVASFAIRRQVLHLQLQRPARVLTDSLVVVERSHQRDSVAGFVTGPVFSGTGASASLGITRRLRGPDWADSTKLPWVNPMPSPDGKFVAEERVSAHGTDLFIIGPRREDTAAVVTGGTQSVALGWSPDSRSLLVSRARTLADGSYDADLFKYSVGGAPRLVPIDTSAKRAVTEAAWSPDGLRIAWVAQVSPQRRQIFVSRPDASGIEELADSLPENFDIAWSPDASLLGFTSRHDGQQRLYAYDFGQRRLWSLTTGSGEDDHLAFSPDGKSAAFESIRDGNEGVYVMAALGGVPTRVTSVGRDFVLVGWRGRPIPYVDRIRIIGVTTMSLGDTTTFGLIGVDQSGASIRLQSVVWSLLDSGAFVRVPVRDSGARADTSAFGYRLVAARVGAARLAVSLPGWRGDTVTITAARGRTVLADDDFAHGLRSDQWVALGEPLPRVGPAPDGSGGLVVYPNAGAGFGSGILSTGTIELRQGLTIEARLYAPFNETALLPGSIEVALVAPTAVPVRGMRPPELSPLVAISWSGETDQVTYSVGTLTQMEPAAPIGAGNSHLLRITVGNGDSVTFFVDGKARWRSSLQLLGDETARGHARLWIGGVTTSSWNGAVGAVRAGIAPR
jgi:DNA-binding SARP family transcriptional activator/Tol biopolymer transport system component